MAGSGEATPFDPFIFIPGGGARSGVSAVGKTVANTVGRNAVASFRQIFLPNVRSDVRSALPQASRLQTLTNRGRTLRSNAREITRKISPTAAVVTGGAVTVAGLAQTPASVENIKNVSQATEATAKAAGQFGDFIQKNPLLVYGALGLIGFAVVYGMVKR